MSQKFKLLEEKIASSMSYLPCFVPTSPMPLLSSKTHKSKETMGLIQYMASKSKKISIISNSQNRFRLATETVHWSAS